MRCTFESATAPTRPPTQVGGIFGSTIRKSGTSMGEADCRMFVRTDVRRCTSLNRPSMPALVAKRLVGSPLVRFPRGGAKVSTPLTADGTQSKTAPTKTLANHDNQYDHPFATGRRFKL